MRRLLIAAILAGLILSPGPAPATVAEQRARLPPPAECTDPITGTWMGLSYYPNHGQWYEFTLEIRRPDPAEPALTGTILAHFWDGSPDASEPGACMGGGSQRIKIRQEAAGTFTDGVVFFGGTSWELQEAVCGTFAGSYSVEQFKGTLDPALNEFQSVNDWNASDYDEPTVFRRIRCADDAGPLPPRPGTAKPGFFPKNKKAGGC